MTLIIVPFITSGIMFIIKWIGGFASTDNPTRYTGVLRLTLMLLSFIGIVAGSALNGTPLDPDSISSIVKVLIEGCVSFLTSHGFYQYFFKPQE
jgi:hypothetical protein